MPNVAHSRRSIQQQMHKNMKKPAKTVNEVMVRSENFVFRQFVFGSFFLSSCLAYVSSTFYRIFSPKKLYNSEFRSIHRQIEVAKIGAWNLALEIKVFLLWKKKICFCLVHLFIQPIVWISFFSLFTHFY